MISPVRKVTTNVIRQTPSDSRHFSDYHWFLSQGRWCAKRVGQQLLELLVQSLPWERDDRGRLRLYLVLDETLVKKVGRRIPGVAWFHNAQGGECRGHHQFGNQWLVIGLLCQVLGQTLCLPLRACLYKRRKDCSGGTYRPARELFCEMIDDLAWPKDAVLTLIGDRFFGSKEMIAYCIQRGYHLITRVRINTRVHLPPDPLPAKTLGRRRIYGEKVDLRQMASNPHQFSSTVRLYKRGTKARYATFLGVLRGTPQLVRVVVLRIEDSCHPKASDPMVLVCTDLSMPPEDIAKRYAQRFQMEMTFRDLKQHHGFGHYQARSQKAVERHAQLAIVACSLLRMLTLTQEQWLPQTPLTRLIVGPWNRNQERLSANQVRQHIFAAGLLDTAFSALPLAA